MLILILKLDYGLILLNFFYTKIGRYKELKNHSIKYFKRLLNSLIQTPLETNLFLRFWSWLVGCFVGGLVGVEWLALSVVLCIYLQ